MSPAVDPEDKDYVCSLDVVSLERARVDLFEDPSQRLGAIHNLRAWIRAQPHIEFRIDTDYLLQILRTAKFSQLRAREIVENIALMRCRYPSMTTNLDTQEPGILEFIKKGMFIPLPKPDKEGRWITIIRPCVLDFNNTLMTVTNEIRASLALQELIKENNEHALVNGAQIVFDLTDGGSKLLKRMTPETAKINSRLYQDSNTGRIKAFHVYNGGSVIDILFGIVKPLIKKKYTERLHTHDSMESLYKAIPMELWPEEYLPDDYTGPNAGSIQDIIDNLKSRLTNPGFRARLWEHTSDRYKMDESKKPKIVPRQESFRMLSVE